MVAPDLKGSGKAESARQEDPGKAEPKPGENPLSPSCRNPCEQRASQWQGFSCEAFLPSSVQEK